GKEECWLVLQAGASAKAYLGLKEGVSIDRLASGLSSGELGELLNTIELRSGDVVHVPPGTVHALGGDVLVLEVQQNSDATHRLSDWGRGRSIHMDEGLSCIDVNSRPKLNHGVSSLVGGGHRLVSTPYFSMYRYRLEGPVEISGAGGYCVLVGIDGSGSVIAGGCERDISDRALLVPACLGGFVVQPTSSLDLVICAPGGITVTDCIVSD
ncbi:MAG: mannose-6-phosphate isomerase, partial [Planctomycetota bacterium]